MDDTHLQETAARLDARIDTLTADMKAGFAHAFEQTQGGFDAMRDFTIFLDERLRGEMNERFNRVERRLDGMDERSGRVERRLDAIDERFNHVERRFDGLDDRFDRLEKMIKER